MAIKSNEPSYQDQEQKLVGLLKSALADLDSGIKNDKLFPSGVTKISLSFSIAGGASLSLNVEGPQSAPTTKDKVSLGDHSAFYSMDVSLNVNSLNLAPHAQAGADSLIAQFGASITFTSGRRTVTEQCRAMAQNIVSTGSRKWISDTYIAGQELQDWVDQHPKAVSVADLQAGLESVMSGWDDTKLGKISYHLSGAAFDIAPVDDPLGKTIKTAIRKLANLNKFIDGEGGVDVWHLQFTE